jgi:hypothetical protein
MVKEMYMELPKLNTWQWAVVGIVVIVLLVLLAQYMGLVKLF